MTNRTIMIVGGALFGAGLLLEIIWYIVTKILFPVIPSNGPFSYDPTTLFLGAMLIGILIFLISLFIPE